MVEDKRLQEYINQNHSLAQSLLADGMDATEYVEAVYIARELQSSRALIERLRKALELIKGELHTAMTRSSMFQREAAMQCLDNAMLNIDAVLSEAAGDKGEQHEAHRRIFGRH